MSLGIIFNKEDLWKLLGEIETTEVEEETNRPNSVLIGFSEGYRGAYNTTIGTKYYSIIGILSDISDINKNEPIVLTLPITLDESKIKTLINLFNYSDIIKNETGKRIFIDELESEDIIKIMKKKLISVDELTWLLIAREAFQGEEKFIKEDNDN